MGRWNDELDQFLIDNVKGTESRELANMINEQFGTSFTSSAIKNRKVKLGVQSGLDYQKCGEKYRWGKYHKPDNKGKKMSEETRAKVSKTMFQKGNIPSTVKPLYSIRRTKFSKKSGIITYTMIKVREGNNGWTQYQRYIWEQEKGEKLTKNDVIIFIDGNNENFNINNLEKMSRAELVVLNNCYPLGKNAEENKTKILMAKINYRRHEMARKKGMVDNYGNIRSEILEKSRKYKAKKKAENNAVSI